MRRALVEYKGITFDELGQWKINEIIFHQNTHAQVNKSVSIIADCLATVQIQGVRTLCVILNLNL